MPIQILQKNRHVNCGTLPCLNYKSETKGVFLATNAIFDMLRQKGKPSKRSKTGGAKGSVAILKESLQLGSVSQDSCPRKSILRGTGILGSKHAVKFSKGTWHQIKTSGKKGSIARDHPIVCAT